MKREGRKYMIFVAFLDSAAMENSRKENKRREDREVRWAA